MKGIDPLFPPPEQDIDANLIAMGLLKPDKVLRDALSLPLLFHSGSPWDEKKRAEWKRITGTDEATTKVLCGHMRSVLDYYPTARRADLWRAVAEREIANAPGGPADTSTAIVAKFEDVFGDLSETERLWLIEKITGYRHELAVSGRSTA